MNINEVIDSFVSEERQEFISGINMMPEATAEAMAEVTAEAMAEVTAEAM